MRSLMITAAAVVAGLAMPAMAQLTLDFPVGEIQPYHKDSGVRPNPADRVATVYKDTVRLEGAAWLRLYFGDVELERGSFIRITSLLDGEVQTLDAAELRMWGDSSAYFNGDAVEVELVADSKTTRSRLVIEQVATEASGVARVGGCTFPCGICGADDRVPSSEDFAGRLLPAGCTASVWNQNSCLVCAGHCIFGNMVVQFRVPDSNPNCTINHPPVADQFPIVANDFQNGGVGADWAVMTSGTNNLGEKAFDRYGALRPIASVGPSVGDPLTVWGFGIDDQCTQSQIQQTADGSVDSVSGAYFNHTVDITCGNSGSSIIRNGEILGIVTHCPCPGVATRVDHPSFAAARNTLCGGGGGGVLVDGDSSLTLGDFGQVSDFDIGGGLGNHLAEQVHYVSINNGPVLRVDSTAFNVVVPLIVNGAVGLSVVRSNDGQLQITFLTRLMDQPGQSALYVWWTKLQNLSGSSMDLTQYVYTDWDLGGPFGDWGTRAAGGNGWLLQSDPFALPGRLFWLSASAPQTHWEIAPWSDTRDKLDAAAAKIDLQDATSPLNGDITETVQFDMTIPAAGNTHMVHWFGTWREKGTLLEKVYNHYRIELRAAGQFSE